VPVIGESGFELYDFHTHVAQDFGDGSLFIWRRGGDLIVRIFIKARRMIAFPLIISLILR
jgi:hypothetical protein